MPTDSIKPVYKTVWRFSIYGDKLAWSDQSVYLSVYLSVILSFIKKFNQIYLVVINKELNIFCNIKVYVLACMYFVTLPPPLSLIL